MDEIEVIEKVLFFRGFIDSLQSKSKTEQSLEFVEFLNCFCRMWAEYSVKQKEVDKLTAKIHELESKLECYGKFLGVQ